MFGVYRPTRAPSMQLNMAPLIILVSKTTGDHPKVGSREHYPLHQSSSREVEPHERGSLYLEQSTIFITDSYSVYLEHIWI